MGLGRARGTLSRAPRVFAIALAAPVLLAAGCGGGSPQTTGEPKGNFPIRVVGASFPLAQAVSRPTNLTLAVRNVGSSTAPNVAITVNSFEYKSSYPNLADPNRPTWVIEQGPGPIASPPVETQEVSQPGGAVTAYVHTWALGPLAPGAVHVFTWHVVPVKTGLQVVRYVVAAGLAGNAKAVRPIVGGPVKGAFVVHIGTEPPPTHVDPNTGQVVPGPAPQTP